MMTNEDKDKKIMELLPTAGKYLNKIRNKSKFGSRAIVFLLGLILVVLYPINVTLRTIRRLSDKSVQHPVRILALVVFSMLIIFFVSITEYVLWIKLALSWAIVLATANIAK